MPNENREFNGEKGPIQHPEAGQEFYDTASTKAPETRQWPTEAEKAAGAEATARILNFKPKEAQPEVEVKVSDGTQRFIDRLAASKTEAERTAIMNEALVATQSGKMPPDEAAEFLQQAA